MLQLAKTKGAMMHDTTDPIDLTIRTLVLLVIVGIFYFVLTSKKKKDTDDKSDSLK